MSSVNLKVGKTCRVYLLHGTKITDHITGTFMERNDHYVVLDLFMPSETIYIPHENICYIAVEDD